jgi:predicted Zn finger-like uncharacterized protein
MRLTCPNCGAEYEVSDGMVPPAGRHVQCTSCHTRWFVRGGPGTGLTEDQILRRLETWSPGPRPLPSPATSPAGPAPAAAAEAADIPAEPADPPVVVHLPPRPPAPAKPADRPAATRPAPLSAPARPQPAPRLDLGEPAPPPAAAAPRPRSRVAHGLVLALFLAALALATYAWREAIAAQVPQARPALTAYARTIDGWRARLEERLAPLRPGAAPGPEGQTAR